MCGISSARQSTAAVLKRIGLEGCAESVSRLSKGTRQRVSLARALVHQPTIVILDEPYSGLDDDGRQWLSTWLADQRTQMRAICFTTHDERNCAQVADRRMKLIDGKLVRCN
jgi:ABC-type multidrug transport system ATPase subunit